MLIRDVASTDLFVGAESRPLQLLRVTVRNEGPAMLRAGQTATIRVEGPGVGTPEPAVVRDPGPGAEHMVDVAVEVDSAVPAGSGRRVTVLAESSEHRRSREADMVVGEAGWTMFMVSHFHYDPVWWNTQAGFTATWYDLPAAEGRRPPEVRTAFDLVGAHLDAARRDPDYKFVLAELDYLKPHWDAHPEDRSDLRRFIEGGRIEIVGGHYNEPNTNLTSVESTVRNAVYGVGFQRDVLGGDPRTAWMLDVFGHDPAYPGLMADAGLSSSSWARGPFHQWGPKHTVGDNGRMQFPSEFEWISPSGRGLLTSYMPNHYGAGWAMNGLSTLTHAEAEAYRQFQDLKQVAATRNTLLPVGGDHVVPSRWVTEIHRDWNRRYVWPRFVAAVPREFFAAVQKEARDRGLAFTPQSRDMNPVYTGKDVSYIDTKQAQRAAETAVLDGERLATLAALLGARYPSEALDKAWRQLVFGAHHDAITGTESDQVYLDLLGGWREAYELGEAVRTAAIDHIGRHVDTYLATNVDTHLGTHLGTGDEGRSLLVVNTLSWPRGGVVRVTLTFPAPGTSGVEVRDDTGVAVPTVLEGAGRHDDGSLAEVALAFLAREVPGLGYRTYRAVSADTLPAAWSARSDGTAIENSYFRVEADPARGGALARILDRRTGKEVLRPGEVGNEVVVGAEYPAHPQFAEGPWHLLPTGREHGSGNAPAEVRTETSPAGQRIVSTWSLDEVRVTQEVLLWAGVDRVDCRTHVDGSIGHDRLLRVRFPADVAGGRPVYEVGNAAVGRTFGFPRADAATEPWTYDNPAYTWVGTTSTARIALRDDTETDTDDVGHRGAAAAARPCHAIGVAEVVAPDVGDDGVRDLVAALVAQGVTATCTTPNGPRYGASDLDSNLPDLRIALGGPDENPFTARVLALADPGYGERLRARLEAGKTARVLVPARRTRARTWVPNADLRGALDLPVLVVADGDLDRAVAGLVDDVADAVIEATGPAASGGGAEPLEDYSVALLNRGTPGCLVDPSGTLYLSLMRSCSGWPSGGWVDPPQRTVPDGTSFSWQHWSHTFDYSLVAGSGDWRSAGFVHHGREFNHELLARVVDPRPGSLPAVASLLEIEPRDVVLTALKPRGNPLASGRTGQVETWDGLTVRCYEALGRPAEARVRCFVPLRDAAPADLLEAARAEAGDGDAPEVVTDEDGALRFRLGPADTTTVAAVPAPPPDAPGRSDRFLGPRGEPAQPVYSRYWLHNKGPAPYGYVPVSVHVEPTVLGVEPPGVPGADRAATLRVTVASSATDGHREGRLEIVAPPGFEISLDRDPGDPPDRHVAYHLRPGEHVPFDLTVRAGDVPPGRYFLAARIADELGQTLEDVATLDVGGPPPTDEGDLATDLATERVTLAPGEGDTITLRLHNPCRDEIRGEAQLLSPFGTWEALGPWTQGFTVGAGETEHLRYDVRAPIAARPGEYWALVKVMYYGRLRYSEAIPVVILDAPRSARGR